MCGLTPHWVKGLGSAVGDCDPNSATHLPWLATCIYQHPWRTQPMEMGPNSTTLMSLGLQQAIVTGVLGLKGRQWDPNGTACHTNTYLFYQQPLEEYNSTTLRVLGLQQRLRLGPQRPLGWSYRSNPPSTVRCLILPTSQWKLRLHIQQWGRITLPGRVQQCHTEGLGLQ